ncbi:MAG: hypothetical protein A3F17_05460 [Gammaproteobacteria bacterium RIFCSPHIGHO2_12_FULL_41_15]|nr:MAG: hypothetical protein A3F17_05460 [Gammaproteobacteria bacterium RIFCSPHIGHO2_12_FULL_41_15]
MKAIILAAGRGRRLEQLTETKPKCLLKVKNKSLLCYQLEALMMAGISEIAIVTGYLFEKIYHSDISMYFHNPIWYKTNMVYSLTLAKPWLEQTSCIVTYSDIFYQPNAIFLLMHALTDIAITYDPNFLALWEARFKNPLDDLETFKTNEQGLLKEIGKKPKNLNEIMGQYMGLIKITPIGWAHIKQTIQRLSLKTFQKIDMTSLLQLLLKNDTPIQCIPYEDIWGEIDYKSDQTLYNADNLFGN